MFLLFSSVVLNRCRPTPAPRSRFHIFLIVTGVGFILYVTPHGDDWDVYYERGPSPQNGTFITSEGESLNYQL